MMLQALLKGFLSQSSTLSWSAGAFPPGQHIRFDDLLLVLIICACIQESHKPYIEWDQEITLSDCSKGDGEGLEYNGDLNDEA